MTSAERRGLPRRTIRRLMILGLLLLACLLGFGFSLNMGALDLSFSRVLAAMFADPQGTPHQIIYNIRLPRTLVAALVGVCLSLSGCLLQAVMRNPLAAPHIIGVSAGAGLAGIFVLILYPGAYYLLTPAAFAGAVATTTLIYLLAWRQGLEPNRLILAGVAVSSLLGAGITAMMVFYPDRVHSVLGFMIGGLSARSWTHFQTILPYAAVGFIWANLTAYRLNILLLGDDIASGLGIHLERTRLMFIALASLLAASAVSVAGLLGFVGLMVPHMTRLIIGSDYRFLLPASALFGAALLMICDTVARVIMEPVELPVGIIMSLLGAPFFLYLLRTSMRET